VITIDIGFDPVIARIGAFELGWHGIFTAIAVIAGIWLAHHLASRRGIPTDVVANIATWAVLGGIVGARLFHVLDHLSTYIEDPLSMFAVWQGGIAVYGAFIGGLLAGGIAAWRARADLWPLLDIAAPATLVGQAIGRLGCLPNGDAWGPTPVVVQSVLRFGIRIRTICCRTTGLASQRTPTLSTKSRRSSYSCLDCGCFAIEFVRIQV
jgi:phosphatidylglycerol:prolipoprotein diacylglycerol transferase